MIRFPILVILLLLFILSGINATDRNVLMTEVFEIEIDPSMFNWTYEGTEDQYAYEPTLANSPSLPSWVHYIYSERHNSGFLYGVPPLNEKKIIIPLQIVGLNKKNFETRTKIINIVVTEKRVPAKYEVHLKIDNLNIIEMFEIVKMEELKDIFRQHLWKDSEEDLYVTFLESAVDLGARKPLNPDEPEGVIIRLGSENSFSQELINLQEEIRPLYELLPCPRNFKRTSVERLFRDFGFELDWCSFKLINKEYTDNSAQHKSSNKILIEDTNEDEDLWEFLDREDIPKRNYTNELLMTFSIPTMVLFLLASILTLILCFENENLIDEASEFFFDNLYHICLDCVHESMEMEEIRIPAHNDDNFYLDETNPPYDEQDGDDSNDDDDQILPNTPNHIRNLSPSLNYRPIIIRDNSAASHGAIIHNCFHNNNNNNNAESPNLTMNTGGMHCRPSPPPYVRPKFKPTI